MNPISNNKFTVNIYDIFANFLPGIILISGLLLPYANSNLISAISFSTGTVTLFIAFAVGGFIQGIASLTKKYQYRLPKQEFPSAVKKESRFRFLTSRKLPFNHKLEQIDGDNSNKLPIPEQKFKEACKSVLELNDTDTPVDDDGYLFKVCLTYLEASPYNRTLRIQAQHLATRGLYTTSFLLSGYYLCIFTFELIDNGVLIDMNAQYSFQPIVFLLLSGLSLILFHLFYLRSIDFEEDVVKYLISEIYLSSQVQAS